MGTARLECRHNSYLRGRTDGCVRTWGQRSEDGEALARLVELRGMAAHASTRTTRLYDRQEARHAGWGS